MARLLEILLGLVTLLHVAQSYILPHMHKAARLGKSDVTPTNRQRSRRHHRLSQLQAFASPDDFLHLQSLILSFGDIISTQTTEHLNHQDAFINTASIIIADATTTAPAAEQSWWDTYLNGIKSSISLVHTAIDQPLRNAGFEQTWGVAIFLFTAGMLHFLFSILFIPCIRLYSIDACNLYIYRCPIFTRSSIDSASQII